MEIGTDVYIQPRVKQIASGNLLQSAESPALCPGALCGRRGMGWDGRRAEEEGVCVCTHIYGWLTLLYNIVKLLQ